MSWSVILIISLVLCMAVGPVMMLQPSKRQRRIAKLRSSAASMGLTVRLATLGENSMAVYAKHWPSDKQRAYSAAAVMLEKKPYAHGLHLAEYWQLNGPATLSEPVKLRLAEQLKALPEDVVAVEMTSGGVGAYWRESGELEQLSQVEQWLVTAVTGLWPHVSRVKPS